VSEALAVGQFHWVEITAATGPDLVAEPVAVTEGETAARPGANRPAGPPRCAP
jgi:hypothetical protein